MILNRSSSRIVIEIRSVAAIAASGAGKSAAGQLTRPKADISKWLEHDISKKLLHRSD
ncbi:hypothetical protein BVIET440_100071 [Burkholderia vietnamiensis]